MTDKHESSGVEWYVDDGEEQYPVEETQILNAMPSLREAARGNPDVVVTESGDIQLAPHAKEATVCGVVGTYDWEEPENDDEKMKRYLKAEIAETRPANYE